jgi:glyoxalase family protein
MKPQITGLHHVTATVSEAQPDIDFYTGLLGLRLVKTTVNFDNSAVYHLYYGNARGTPSTLMTTFPYGGWSVPEGVRGSGQIHVTSFSVPAGALDFWRDRFSERGADLVREDERFGSRAATITDPSGLHIELVESAEDARAPWTGGGVDGGSAIRGVHGVTLLLPDSGPTLRFVTDVLGFDVEGEEGARTKIAIGGGGAGATLELLRSDSAARAVNGLGTVHHVAFAVDDSDEQLRIREHLVREGVGVTEVRDRQYFQSIYFREPGGVLFEIATAGPGFLIDEDETTLGQSLRLPSWEETNRATIEARLSPIVRR